MSARVTPYVGRGGAFASQDMQRASVKNVNWALALTAIQRVERPVPTFTLIALMVIVNGELLHELQYICVVFIYCIWDCEHVCKILCLLIL